MTVELLDGTRKVQADVFLKETRDDRYCWCTTFFDRERRTVEEIALWYEVIAWAYYPDYYVR